MTLEQQRAADAWRCAQGRNDEYVKLAKGLPALIMNSGLLQVLAFLEEKGAKNDQSPHRQLSKDLRVWLGSRFPGQLPAPDFRPFMEALIQSPPAEFRRITQEAFAWLRWVRQVAPAVVKGGQ